MLLLRNGKFGVKEVFFYGVDESTFEEIKEQIPILKKLHKIGAKIYVALDDPRAITASGNLIDIIIICFGFRVLTRMSLRLSFTMLVFFWLYNMCRFVT